MDWQNLLVTAGIQSGIGILFWFLIQRQVEKFDRLQQRLNDLEDKRITAIETKAANEAESNSARHKEIYVSLAKLEREAVTNDKCHEQHQELLEGMQEYRAAVVDLKGVQVELKATAKFVSEVNERVIGLMQDVSALRGRPRA